MLEVTAEVEAAAEKQTVTEAALEQAGAQSKERAAQLEQLMQAQGRLTEQLSEFEAQNEVESGHTSWDGGQGKSQRF